MWYNTCRSEGHRLLGVMNLPKVLVADDNVGTAGLMKILLELEGYQVVTTSDAREIIGLVEREQPDLLVMDFYLGKESGLETLCVIRSRPTIADTPVVMMSGINHGVDVVAAGADAFVLKPFDADELLSVVKRVLSQREKGSSN